MEIDTAWNIAGFVTKISIIEGVDDEVYLLFLTSVPCAHIIILTTLVIFYSHYQLFKLNFD